MCAHPLTTHSLLYFVNKQSHRRTLTELVPNTQYSTTCLPLRLLPAPISNRNPVCFDFARPWDQYRSVAWASKKCIWLRLAEYQKHFEGWWQPCCRLGGGVAASITERERVREREDQERRYDTRTVFPTNFRLWLTMYYYLKKCGPLVKKGSAGYLSPLRFNTFSVWAQATSFVRVGWWKD